MACGSARHHLAVLLANIKKVQHADPATEFILGLWAMIIRWEVTPWKLDQYFFSITTWWMF